MEYGQKQKHPHLAIYLYDIGVDGPSSLFVFITDLDPMNWKMNESYSHKNIQGFSEF
jgi:hypothetical protein